MRQESLFAVYLSGAIGLVEVLFCACSSERNVARGKEAAVCCRRDLFMSVQWLFPNNIQTL